MKKQALNSNADFADIRQFKVHLELSQHKHEVSRVFPVQLTGQSFACQFRVGAWVRIDVWR